MKKSILLSLTATLLLANGYKIPEQSLFGIALSSANIANSNSADSAYYNPANMSFLKDKNYFELTSLFIHLNKVKFKNQNGEIYYSRKEDFALPLFHFVSKDINGFRFGFSITYPAGLSKRWDDVVPEAGAKEFTLKTVEFNPSISKKINNNFSIAFGVRFVKSEGVANVLGLKQNSDGSVTPLYSQYLNGTSFDKGWNVALAYKNKDIKIATTYRSKINLSLSGKSSGYYLTNLVLAKNPSLPLPANSYISFNTSGKVTVPIPAVFDLAVAKTFNKTTIEVVFERTYWSKYKKLDFDFKDKIVDAIFGNPKPKKWKDENTYRIGITHKCSNKLTAMVGYAYDKTPVPDSTIDFSLPDSDKHIFSAGIKYKLDDRMSIGIAGLYTKQKSRNAKIYDPVSNSYTIGKFEKGGAYLIGIGLNYSY